MRLKFTKMQGAGNDYIYVDGFKEHVPDEKKPALARSLSDRHFGIGGDGMIFINPSNKADFEMEMYNADGTRGEMCGNGIRCVAKYVFDNKLTSKECFDIESFGKVKKISVYADEGKAKKIKVDMGSPILESKDIPVNVPGDKAVDIPFECGPYKCRMTCVSMGNPHAVILMDSLNIDTDIEDMDIAHIGPYFENDEHFPKRVNTEFVKIIDRDNIRMRVWERGTGETLACGTGCCASAVACILSGLVNDKLNVHVLGGTIEIFWDRESNHVYMSGPAEKVFDGEVEI